MPLSLAMCTGEDLLGAPGVEAPYPHTIGARLIPQAPICR
jgi:hypothetical protein